MGQADQRSMDWMAAYRWDGEDDACYATTALVPQMEVRRSAKLHQPDSLITARSWAKIMVFILKPHRDDWQESRMARLDNPRKTKS